MHSAMEHTRYLMWTRRKIGIRPPPPPPLFGSPVSMVGSGSTYHESWEEQAFAEDSSGLLGGCVWPPRSYSCSFCRREFRSAQALGGHMNVHRRDRARLKQSSSSPTRENPTHQASSTRPDQCYMITNPNPNPNSGVEYTLVSPSYPPLTLDEQQIDSSSNFPIHRSSTNPFPARLLNIPDLNLGMGNWKLKEMGIGLGKRDREQVDDDEMVIGNKRRRFDPLVFPSIVKPTEVLKFGSSPVEELDLELRLGDPPKVK